MAPLNTPWLDYWASRPLSPLAGTLARLQPFTRRPERVEPAAIAAVVLSDPLLTLQVLRAVNLRNRSVLASDVVSVEKAIMLFGVTPFLEQFARVRALDEGFAGDVQRQYRYEVVVDEVMLAIRVARDLANRRYDARLDEISLATLVSFAPRLLQLAAPPDAPQPDADAIRLAARWQLPAVVARLLVDEGEETPDRSVLLQASVALAHSVTRGWWQGEVSDALDRTARVLDVDHGQAWRWVTRQMLAHAERSRVDEQIYPAARWLPMLPGPWPATRPAPAPVPAVAPSAAPAETARVSRLTALLSELESVSRIGGAPNQIMSLALKTLVEGLHLRRVALLLLNAEATQLQARFVHGALKDDALHRFKLELALPTVFAKLLAKPQCVMFDAARLLQWQSHLPPVLITQIGSGPFVAMSLFVGRKPIGAIYADWQPEHAPAAAQQQTLARIAELTSRALGVNAPQSSTNR
ncbi:HDOD domain-containing protein [Chitinibacteraceae bacterium HSL-7]